MAQAAEAALAADQKGVALYWYCLVKTWAPVTYPAELAAYAAGGGAALVPVRTSMALIQFAVHPEKPVRTLTPQLNVRNQPTQYAPVRLSHRKHGSDGLPETGAGARAGPQDEEGDSPGEGEGDDADMAEGGAAGSTPRVDFITDVVNRLNEDDYQARSAPGARCPDSQGSMS